MGHRLGLLERLEQGIVLGAEGYVFELERRGYVQAGAYVPEVVMDHPEAVKQLHREFLRAGAEAMASAILGVNSPIMPLAKMMEILPRMTSAVGTVRMMAFSPLAPRLARAFIIWAVATAFVPKATTSCSSRYTSFRRLIKAAPMPPP